MKAIITAAMLLIINIVSGQHQELAERPGVNNESKVSTRDTTSLLSAFKRGYFNGHFRYFFMNTQNQKGLTDYYAHAAGIGIGYETAKFHGFQFALSGFSAFNLGSSDLGKPDPVTGQKSRYETGLFDVEDPYNKKDNYSLLELLLKYNYRQSFVVLGKQKINTPFINLQDGRMSPTVVEGLWLEINEFKKIKLEGGWLYGVSPRGTTRWFGMGESIGVYPAGVNINGAKSQYTSNIKSKGLLLLGTHFKMDKKITLHAWDVFTENVFNTALLQADLSFPLHDNENIFVAAQVIRQNALNDGGNADAAKTYFEKGGRTLTFGGRAGWKNKHWETELNYNRTTGDGRYLMPREWGREPFFTYLPRERNEGCGNVQALMGKIEYSLPATGIKASVAAGYYRMPDVKDYRLNKYGLPSYTQLNADIRYSFSKILEGLEARVLIVAKARKGETWHDKKFEFNKVDLQNYNVVLNYHFKL